MSDSNSVNDWSFVVFVLGLVVLCAGDPDLLDALVARVMECGR